MQSEALFVTLYTQRTDTEWARIAFPRKQVRNGQADVAAGSAAVGLGEVRVRTLRHCRVACSFYCSSVGGGGGGGGGGSGSGGGRATLVRIEGVGVCFEMRK